MRRMGLRWLTAVCFVAACTFCCIDALSVSSIDPGNAFTKIAIVSPRVPMEIALNEESKRKTPTTVTFRDKERLFGSDALTASVRFPKQNYAYLLDLIGKKVDNPIVQLYQKRFPYYDIVPDPDRGTVLFQHDNQTTYSPEELLSMILYRAKKIASNSAGEETSGAIITVPGFFNQAERSAVLQAAELAGIKVLELKNDYTAVALNYGIFRRKDFNETAQYVMFYDMGATSTTATIISYQVVKTKDKGFVESHPQLAVLGVGYDRTLGGLDCQIKLRDYLGTKFNEMKKTKNDVFKVPRAMAKLLKEAGRVKEVLSANDEHYAQVENVMDDVDLKVPIKRLLLEELCADHRERVKGPIEQALKHSGLSMDLIPQVVPVGGGTRMPLIQDAIVAATGRNLSRHLNSDEACALGAAYRAAELSAGFKVKPFLIKDAVVHPIQVLFEREVEGQETPKQVKRMLFGLMNPYPQKKVITYKHSADFSFDVMYDLDHLNPEHAKQNGDTYLTKIHLSGVSEALAKHSGPNAESKGIKAHFALDSSGILQLVGVDLHVEKNSTAEDEESTLSKLGSTFSQLFSGSEDTAAPAQKDDKEDKPVHEESEEKESKEDKDAKKEKEDKEGKKEEEDKESSKEKEKSKEVKPILVKEPVAAKLDWHGVVPIPEEKLASYKLKIKGLNDDDEKRARREQKLNALESFVFNTMSKLDEPPYAAAATQEEAEKIREACTEASTWLEDEGFEADAEAYDTKLKALKSLTTDLQARVNEHEGRPEALANIRQTLNSSYSFLNNALNLTSQKKATGEPWVFTEVELTTLEKLLKETTEWLDNSEKEQAALKPHEPVKLTLQGIAEKIALVNREIAYLMHKVKIWKPPKPKEEAPKEEATKEEAPKEEAPKEEAPKNDTAKGGDKTAPKEKVLPPTEEAKEEVPVEAKKTEGESEPSTPLGDTPEVTPTKPDESGSQHTEL